jgi:hypothetical protein
MIFAAAAVRSDRQMTLYVLVLNARFTMFLRKWKERVATEARLVKSVSYEVHLAGTGRDT